MEKKRVKKFKAFLNPRFLPGQVQKHILLSDLLEYNKHRYKVFMSEPRVDDKPLQISPTYYINSQRLINDAIRLQQIDKENKELLKKINTINRMGGRVDTYNPIAYQNFSKWRSHELEQIQIVRANKDLHKRITKAQSLYSVKSMNEFWKHICEKMAYTCKFPLVLLQKKTLDQMIEEQPSISTYELSQSLVVVDRPKCFMDFRVKDGVYLGRIIIELYNDIVPVTVQNFLGICSSEGGLSYRNCPIHYVSPKQYFDTGDITKGNGKGGTSIYGYTFPEENHKLKHTKAGVLSTISVGRHLNNSLFGITLAPVEKLDSSRVVFGKVVKGHDTLCKISDLGLKIGRPAVPILIHDHGPFIKGETPTILKKFKF